MLISYYKLSVIHQIVTSIQHSELEGIITLRICLFGDLILSAGLLLIILKVAWKY
jgi:hypothetical protein